MINKVYIFTSEPFPVGLAGTNRIIAHASGFIANQIQTEIIIFRRTENSNKIRNTQTKGVYKGIRFIYLSKSTVKSSSFIVRRLEVFFNYLLLLIFYIKNVDNNSFSIYYSFQTFPALIIWFVNRFKKSVIFKEESEHPSVYKCSQVFIESYIFNLIHYSLFDGLILMTKNLVQYFKNERKYNKPILHVPMSVDINRFKISEFSREKWITYCGILNDKKDGTSILINAFKEILNYFPDYQLMLIGEVDSDKDQIYYKNMVKELNIINKVIFLGRINNDQIPMYLMKSSILVLPRPESIQAQHGFPTKLGEYLATGNPVIVTSVGEISLYLKDQVNAFLVVPGDVNHLVTKILEILSNYEEAKMVSQKGKETVLEYFNNINQTKEILDFHNYIKRR